MDKPVQRAVLDTCVLYPTILREILLDVAAAGLFAPVWSARILAEWRHAAARLGAEDLVRARAEIARITDRFPLAMADGDETPAIGFDLPDPADRHVMAAALAAGAQTIVTANLRDFPRRVMVPAGLVAVHPDAFLTAIRARDPDPVVAAVRAAHARARALGADFNLRQMMIRARLPRLHKAMTRNGQVSQGAP